MFFEEKQIVNVISKYFTDLFTAHPREKTKIIEESIQQFVTEEMNEALTKILDTSEIRKICFAIHGDKVSGPDGF